MMQPFQQPYSRDFKDPKNTERKRKHKNRPQFVQAIKRHSKVKQRDQIKQEQAKKAYQKFMMKSKEEAMLNPKLQSDLRPPTHRYTNSLNISFTGSKRQKMLLGSQN